MCVMHVDWLIKHAFNEHVVPFGWMRDFSGLESYAACQS